MPSSLGAVWALRGRWQAHRIRLVVEPDALAV